MNEQKHYLTPLKGKIQTGRHLFLWIAADETRPVLQTAYNRAWDFLLSANKVYGGPAGSWADASALESILDRATKDKGPLTVWLARGWEDLVLSGLAQLLDTGAFTWRYALLDGQRTLIRGLWRGRSIVVTSLANWTGCRYDSWPKVLDDPVVRGLVDPVCALVKESETPVSEREYLALVTWHTLMVACRLLQTVSLPPTVAAAAVQVWRRWLGPQMVVYKSANGKKTARRKEVPIRIVAPSPYRPAASAHAERHCCYGLFLRQLRRGLVDQDIYCVDLRGAYALALAHVPIPVQYERTLHRPSVGELLDKIQKHTGHALVRLDTATWAYPLRRQSAVVPARGQFWTWLASAELVHALVSGHVKECHTAYIWHAGVVSVEAYDALMQMADALQEKRCAGVALAWRAVYSALVGQFAGRRKHWQDISPRNGVDRWSQWVMADVQTGRLRQCRSIAGRQQQLVDVSDTSASVPLVYASVTAFVRWMTQLLMSVAGPENTCALVADSLWVTRKGWQLLQKRCSEVGLMPDNLRTKAIFDRCYFDGKSAVICERNGERILRVPGCRDGTTLDSDYRATDLVAPPWGSTVSLNPGDGVPRRRRTFQGARLIQNYSFPAETIPLGEVVDDPLMPAELLQVPRWGRTVLDEE